MWQWFDAVVAVYGWALDTVLEHERLTLALAALTVLLTVYLYIVIPKGFFPTQDTGVLQGISVAPQSISFAAMAERQQALAAVILEDPDVSSLSSFIGIDGVNMAMNSGRFLVFAQMPGASPETMAATVATPLERYLSAIADVSEMQSENTMGSINIFLMFGLHRNLDGAARDVQAANNAARADLPAALSGNPQYFKDDKAGGPILFVSLVASFDRGVETRAGNSRSHVRRARRRAQDQSCHRPGYGVPPRHHSKPDRYDAPRRLRRSASVNHPWSAQPI
jgi:multidrug efflux pump subunit AcrB